ncbi:PepSY domain-containing protein [Micromonospora sp. NPDC048830]|uniref:PepSY domain-containing protein n=1 Tax=Micromonospora sp. NPDC048830 TaxID=3364257 RepID=UPI00371A3B77
MHGTGVARGARPGPAQPGDNEGPWPPEPPRPADRLLAAIGGAAALAITGAALGVGAADRTDRPAGGTALTAVAATTDDTPGGDYTPGGDRSTGTTTGAPVAGQVSRDRAGQLALAATGGGRIVRIEAESEHGRSVWRVDVVAGSKTYEVDVDRATGAIGRIRREAADDRRGGGSDDRRGSASRDDHPSADDQSGDDQSGDDQSGDDQSGDDQSGDDHGGGRDGDDHPSADDRAGDDHGRDDHGGDD